MWKFALGYVILTIRGLSLERFLNLLLQSGVEAWDVQRMGRTQLRLCIPVKDFEKLPLIRRKCRCSIHIERKCGMPFFAARLWKRKVLCMGMFAAFAAICFLSTRVLFVNYMDQGAVQLQTALQESGVKVGVSLSTDWTRLSNMISAQSEGIKWLGISRRGVYLSVETKAADEKPLTVDYSKSAQIIAQKGGMITRVDCFRGQAAVKVGDRVESGDVLISDTVVYKDFPPYYTHARGEVFAAMQYSTSVTAPTSIMELVPTGRIKRYFRITLNGTEIYQTGCGFVYYQTCFCEPIAATQTLIPLEVSFGEYIELEERERILTEDESVSWALMLAEQQALELVPKDAAILVMSCQLRNCDDEKIAFCTITTEENIGVPKETQHDE
ncbi:MAG: sporulation protein YqfD [Eubacteriales bacterium]|nr:sporulation protein YqfD [Eubacteriales bacterium]